MRPLSGSELLQAWEQAYPLNPAGRCLALLRFARPDLSESDLDRLTIGTGNQDLLALRQATFGSRMSAVVACPDCAESLELELTVAELLPATAQAQPGSAPFSIRECGFEITFRVPTLADLAAIANGGRSFTTEQAEALLRRRLIVEIRSLDGTEPPALGALPLELEAAVSAAMTLADPLAETRLSVFCPDCGSQSDVFLEVGSYFWEELDAWARRLVAEVHMLASAYGWREEDILELSPWRRRLYLDLVTE